MRDIMLAVEADTSVLSQEIARARCQGTIVALITIDVGYSKLYNDRYGHPAGNDLLQ